MLEEKINLSAIDRKLSIVVALLLRIANDGKNVTLKDQIKDLSSYGLSPAEMAAILGKKVSHISKELSEIKKSKK